MVAASPTDVRAILDSIGFPAMGNPAVQPIDALATPGSDGYDGTSPDARLASMLGLDGTVVLGDLLERMQALSTVAPDDSALSLHRQISLTLIKRRHQIRTRVERRYAQAFEGLRPVPGPKAVALVLGQSGALTERSAEALADCAQKVGARYRFMFASTLGVVRKENYWLREDILRALHRVSPRAAQLVQLDKALDKALEQAALKAHRNLEAGVAQRFAEQLIERALQLPGEDPEPQIETWFKPGGFISRFMLDGRRLTYAMLDSEWARLRGLCDACCGTTAAQNPLPPEALEAAGVPDGAPAPSATVPATEAAGSAAVPLDGTTDQGVEQ